MGIRARLETGEAGMALAGIANADDAASVRTFFGEKGIPATVMADDRDGTFRVNLPGVSAEQVAQWADRSNLTLE